MIDTSAFGDDGSVELIVAAGRLRTAVASSSDTSADRRPMNRFAGKFVPLWVQHALPPASKPTSRSPVSVMVSVYAVAAVYLSSATCRPPRPAAGCPVARR